MPAVKAIETQYAGYRFRSRLEARWAVFLDSLGELWEYEKEGYELRHGRYLPDFWLPRLGVWLEIKGQPLTRNEDALCEDLFHAVGYPVAVGRGLPSSKGVPGESLQVFLSDETGSSAGSQWWEACWCLDIDLRLCFATDDSNRQRSFFNGFWEPFDRMLQADEAFCVIGPNHEEKAKSARFEFGEKG